MRLSDAADSSRVERRRRKPVPRTARYIAMSERGRSGPLVS